MFYISNKQLLAFSNSEVEGFIQNSILFLKRNFKSWCNIKNDEDLRTFILEIIALGERYNIKKEKNLQRLMHYRIEFNFDLVKYPKLEKQLKSNSINEDLLIEEFYLALASENYKLLPINLNSSMNSNLKNKWEMK